MKLILPAGISGSGKDFLAGQLQYFCPQLDLKIICMDDIRLRLCKNISDQSRNDEVFKLSQKYTLKSLSLCRNVYYNATNLGLSSLIKTCETYKERFSDLQAYIIYLTVSNTPQICLDRIKKDLSLGIVRADTTSEAVVNKLSSKWNSMRKNHESFVYPEYITTFDYDGTPEKLDELIKILLA
jgi:predicted kinase